MKLWEGGGNEVSSITRKEKKKMDSEVQWLVSATTRIFFYKITQRQ